MKGIELAPFVGAWRRIGPVFTADSVAGKIKDTDTVIKWSRRNFKSADEAFRACLFMNYSVALYAMAFGDNHIVDTTSVVGQKKDGNKTSYKVYVVQPFIYGWEGNSVPKDICCNDNVINAWARMKQRLAMLIFAAHDVNHGLRGNEQFPINITIGKVRGQLKLAEQLATEDDCCPLPSSPNLIVEHGSLDLRLFDFGEYKPWDDRMYSAYSRIWDRVYSQTH